MRLKDKITIVTGAASGIGRATAERFALEGATVVVADINDQGGQETVQSIRQRGGEAYFIHTDVSDASQVKAMVATTVNRYGQLNVIMNNAACYQPTHGLVDTTEEDWNQIINVTLKGVFLGCKYAIPEMIKNGGGTVINVGSIGSILAFPIQAAYLAAKGGVLGLTRSVAIDYAPHGIRANAILPGPIDTAAFDALRDRPDVIEQGVSRTLFKRLGQPQEIAPAAAFLASDESSYMTGTFILIDGGWAVW